MLPKNHPFKSACQAILSKHADRLSHASLRGSRSFLDRSEFDTVYDVLQHHPNASTKIGCGIQAMFVQRDRFGSFCFHLQRVDGSEEDFSYRKIFKMAPSEQQHRYGYSYEGIRGARSGGGK